MAVRKEKCGGSCNSAVGHEGCGKRNKGKLSFYKRLREKCRATEGDGVCLRSRRKEKWSPDKSGQVHRIELPNASCRRLVCQLPTALSMQASLSHLRNWHDLSESDLRQGFSEPRSPDVAELMAKARLSLGEAVIAGLDRVGVLGKVARYEVRIDQEDEYVWQNANCNF